MHAEKEKKGDPSTTTMIQNVKETLSTFQTMWHHKFWMLTEGSLVI